MLLLLWYPFLPSFHPQEHHENVNAQLYEIFQHQLFEETRPPPIIGADYLRTIGPAIYPEEGLAKAEIGLNEIVRSYEIARSVEGSIENIRQFSQTSDVGWGNRRLPDESDESEFDKVELSEDDESWRESDNITNIIEFDEKTFGLLKVTGPIQIEITPVDQDSFVQEAQPLIIDESTVVEQPKIDELLIVDKQLDELPEVISERTRKFEQVHFSPSILVKTMSAEELRDKPSIISTHSDSQIFQWRINIHEAKDNIDNPEKVLLVIHSDYTGDINKERPDVCETDSDECQKIEELVKVVNIMKVDKE